VPRVLNPNDVFGNRRNSAIRMVIRTIILKLFFFRDPSSFRSINLYSALEAVLTFTSYRGLQIDDSLARLFTLYSVGLHIPEKSTSLLFINL